MIELLLAAENALALGLLDQAERTYRQVLAADPRNGIAAVGLSRVALERGDEAGAIVLARTALEIDPENATARRMIDRLEEVVRFRGPAAPAAAGRGAASAPDAGPPQAFPPAVPAELFVPPAASAEPARPPAERFVPPAASPSPEPSPARPGVLRRLLRRS